MGNFIPPLTLPSDIEQAGVAGGLLDFAVFVLFTVAMAFIFIWVFNNTKGSLLLAILLHGSIDGTQTYMLNLADRHLLSETAAADIQLGNTLGIIVLALLLIIFTRGRLSYLHYQHEAEPLDLPSSMEKKPAPPGTTV